MIVVDTSALIAILFQEPDGDIYDDALFDAREARIGAPTLFEYLLVVENKRGSVVRARARQLVEEHGIAVSPWTTDHVTLAEEAFVQFGKGRHPAKLNFGDCMSYALAKSLNAPLLYKGTDFGLTDIRSAV